MRSLCMERRGVEKERMEVDETRMMIKYRLPLNEIIINFHETLKSLTSGFAGFEYDDDGYEHTHIVRLDFTVNLHLVSEKKTARDIHMYRSARPYPQPASG